MKCPWPKCRARRPPPEKDVATTTAPTPLSKQTQLIFRPEEEEEADEKEKEVKQLLGELEQQRKGTENRGWTAMLKEIEEQMKKLSKKRAPQPAAATKDIKVVAADQHNIQSRHEARMKQLENQKNGRKQSC